MDNKVVELYYTQEEWDRITNKCYPMLVEGLCSKNLGAKFTPQTRDTYTNNSAKKLSTRGDPTKQ